MLAYVYPLSGIFWSMLLFFLWILLLFLLYQTFAAILRSRDIGGFAKALWLIFVILVPFLGVIVYVIARSDSYVIGRGGSMADRQFQHVRAQQEQRLDSYVPR